VDHPGQQSGGATKGASKWECKGASGVSQFLGVAKLQSTPGADNLRYATGIKDSHVSCIQKLYNTIKLCLLKFDYASCNRDNVKYLTIHYYLICLAHQCYCESGSTAVKMW